MKHFTITTETEAAALRPFASEPLKVGHIVTPSAGNVTHTAWDNYPESDALTFEECMAVVRDEVTDEVLSEVGELNDFEYSQVVELVQGSSTIAKLKPNAGMQNRVYLSLQQGSQSNAMTEIPNPTATKIKLLAAILRGEDI